MVRTGVAGDLDVIKQGRSRSDVLPRGRREYAASTVEGYAPVDAFTPDEAVKLILQRLAINEADRATSTWAAGKVWPAPPGW